MDLPYRAVGGEDKLVEVDPAVAVLVEGGEDEVGDSEAVLLQTGRPFSASPYVTVQSAPDSDLAYSMDTEHIAA